MNIENIKIGDVYKNYLELCKMLNEETKTGNSKKHQIKEWERYFDFKREGHKYIITNIFTNAKPKNDLRKNGNNTRYEPITITHPDIIKYMSVNKNKGYDLNKITKFSSVVLMWICSKCGNDYFKSVDKVTRINKSVCPICSMSEGERHIYNFLCDYNIPHEYQYSFNDLRGKKGSLLRFDFAIFNNNDLIGLIEYDGEYHSEELNPDYENYLYINEHDKIKNQYCKVNDIPLLRISYRKKKLINMYLSYYLLNINIEDKVKIMIHKHEIEEPLKKLRDKRNNVDLTIKILEAISYSFE